MAVFWVVATFQRFAVKFLEIKIDDTALSTFARTVR
jgi:hypothetical protein